MDQKDQKSFLPVHGAAFLLGLRARKIAVHATPLLAMVKYYTMAPSAATATFSFTPSPPGRAKARGLLGSSFVSLLCGVTLHETSKIQGSDSFAVQIGRLVGKVQAFGESIQRPCYFTPKKDSGAIAWCRCGRRLCRTRKKKAGERCRMVPEHALTTASENYRSF